VVFSKQHDSSWVGVRVYCESTHPAAILPPAKKPIVVQKIIDRLGGARDGSLDVTGTPLFLDGHEVDRAAALIRGQSDCRLPVVYVSAPFSGRHAAVGTSLAKALSGMAHVVIEPDRPFSVRLKLAVNSENVYGGTIGIYWPDGGGRRSFYVGHAYENAEELHEAVVEEVRLALTNRRPLDRCTPAFVQSLVSRSTFEALRAQGSQEIDKYVAEFDRELDAKDSQLLSANREIDRLRAELRKYEARLSVEDGLQVNVGAEQDLYAGESIGFLMDAVKDACDRMAKDSRRRHVLSSVLQANPEPEGKNKFRDTLKELLRGYTSMEPKVRKGLEDLGFSISEEGKHIKLVFQGDDRYTFTLPKSGGDSKRGGLNAAGDIARLLF